MRARKLMQQQQGMSGSHGYLILAGLLFVFSAFFLSGCGILGTVTLEGTVIDAYTGEAVESVEVQVGGDSLEVGSDGEYSTTAWEGSDTLRISAPGYEAVRIPLEEHAPSISFEDVTVTLETELRPNSLDGMVTDSYTGEPVEDAQVAVVSRNEDDEDADDEDADADDADDEDADADDADDEDADADDEEDSAHDSDMVDIAEAAETDNADEAETDDLQATTDDEGTFELEGLAEEFVLRVSAPGYEPVEVELERTTSYDIELRPNVLSGVVTDSYNGDPIEDVEVSIGDLTATTDDDGTYLLEGVPEDARRVSFSVEGYEASSERLRKTTELDTALRPDVLETVLLDQESGEPVGFATLIATETPTSTAVASARIDNSSDGSITLEGYPETGYIQVLAPGYRKAMLEIEPGNIPSQIELEPFKARALYVKTSTAAYLPERMEAFYDLIDRTELNALVIDLKSDNLADLGLIYYDSQVPIVQELGTSADLMDIEAILAEAKRRNIYTIARIHVFAHDNLLAETKPEWAAQDANGCVPNENRKCNGDVFYADWDIAWLDPWNRNVWDYNIQLGIEAAQLGFDEVQFDYIRFPNDAQDIEDMRLSKPIDWRNNPEPMYENIATFMEQSHEALNGVGAFFSVDIFGYAVWSPQKQIGQNAEVMAPHADYICPMVYPSHFWPNELGFDNAAAHPYEIVHESLNYGHEMVGDKRAKMRPWLQDFTLIWVPDPLIVRYGVPEVQAQIQATEDSPYGYGWAVWDPDNEYTIDAFRPEQ